MKKIHIPSLDRMFNDVLAFVRENQGEKGYIDTQDGGDTIHCIVFDEESGTGKERIVYGVRVAKDDDGTEDLEICFEPYTRTYVTEYDEEDFKEAEWLSVRWSDVYFVPTIFNLAEYIEEYA